MVSLEIPSEFHSSREIDKWYKKQALKHHPNKAGNTNTFVKLTKMKNQMKSNLIKYRTAKPFRSSTELDVPIFLAPSKLNEGKSIVPYIKVTEKTSLPSDTQTKLQEFKRRFETYSPRKTNIDKKIIRKTPAYIRTHIETFFKNVSKLSANKTFIKVLFSIFTLYFLIPAVLYYMSLVATKILEFLLELVRKCIQVALGTASVRFLVYGLLKYTKNKGPKNFIPLPSNNYNYTDSVSPSAATTRAKNSQKNNGPPHGHYFLQTKKRIRKRQHPNGNISTKPTLKRGSVLVYEKNARLRAGNHRKEYTKNSPRRSTRKSKKPERFSPG